MACLQLFWFVVETGQSRNPVFNQSKWMTWFHCWLRVRVCMCVGYSQCPQFGHVVEAGQRYEGDVIVVEGAGWRHREGKLQADVSQTPNGPIDISSIAQHRLPATISVRS